MKYKKIDVSGKYIHVFDDIFQYSHRQHLHSFLQNSSYRAQGGASTSIEYLNDVAMSCVFNDEDLANFGITNLFPKQVSDILEGYVFIRCYSLIINFTTKPHFHTDLSNLKKGLTVLYYANNYWNPDWGGETVFADDDLNDAVYCSIYKPGRLIIYDSSIPHKPNTPTAGSPEFRYTFVLNYEEK